MRVTMHIYVQIIRMWIFEIWVLKTIIEPKNETVAGDRRFTTSFKIIRGQRWLRRGGGGVVGVAKKRNAHKEFGGNRGIPTFLPRSKSGWINFFYSKTNKMHNFSGLLNITLQVSDGLSVRSPRLYTQHQVYVIQLACWHEMELRSNLVPASKQSTNLYDI
jgi:hypothetical protein